MTPELVYLTALAAIGAVTKVAGWLTGSRHCYRGGCWLGK